MPCGCGCHKFISIHLWHFDRNSILSSICNKAQINPKDEVNKMVTYHYLNVHLSWPAAEAPNEPIEFGK